MSIDNESFIQKIEINLIAFVRITDKELKYKNYYSCHINDINDLLKKNNYETYKENNLLYDIPMIRCQYNHIPVEWFFKLQILYSKILFNISMNKDINNINEYDLNDENIINEAIRSFPESHLLSHASEGYYIPSIWEDKKLTIFNNKINTNSKKEEIEYSNNNKYDNEIKCIPLFDTENKILGGWIGSSYCLLNDLLLIASTLEINFKPLKSNIPRAGGYDLSENSLKLLQKNQIEMDGKYWQEKVVWFILYECVHISIKYNTAIIMS